MNKMRVLIAGVMSVFILVAVGCGEEEAWEKAQPDVDVAIAESVQACIADYTYEDGYDTSPIILEGMEYADLAGAAMPEAQARQMCDQAGGKNCAVDIFSAKAAVCIADIQWEYTQGDIPAGEIEASVIYDSGREMIVWRVSRVEAADEVSYRHETVFLYVPNGGLVDATFGWVDVYSDGDLPDQDGDMDVSDGE